jgi:hypothetical protein
LNGQGRDSTEIGESLYSFSCCLAMSVFLFIGMIIQIVNQMAVIHHLATVQPV